MRVLGIESTAHTLGIGVIEGKKILINEKYMVTGEGIHPREVSHEHIEKAPVLLSKVFERIKKVDLVAFAKGPGLGPCLRNGAIMARTISQKLDIPLVAVNHCIAHIEIGKYMFNLKDPLVLYLSGANTQIIGLENGRYRIFGETLDIGLGNLIDTFARKVGLGFPGGPKVEKLAEKGKKFIPLPYTVKGNDLVYSGLLTAAVNAVKEHNLEDVCFSLQEVAFSMTGEAFERALAHTKKKEVLLTGGVAANRRLQEIIKTIAKEHNASFHVVPLEYSGDNGVMIAVLGYVMYKAGIVHKIKETKVDQYFRTDAVDITW